MNKIYFFLVFMIFTLCAKSQVAIGSGTTSATVPHEGSVLDLQAKDKGLLLSRVALVNTQSASPLSSHIAGMIVYNTATSGSGAIAVSPGLYYNDGSVWISLPLNYTKWFYMPSIPFETATTATGQKKDLFAEYIKQFGGTTNANFVSSTGAPASIPYLPKANDLYYYITDYDSAVFSNISIDANGVMTYNVTAAATDYSFINIVFVLK